MDTAWLAVRDSFTGCAGYATHALDGTSGDGATREGDEDDAMGSGRSVDLSGRTYVVTGVPTTAIAVECAKRLLRAGARVVCACADVKAGIQAFECEPATTETSVRDEKTNEGGEKATERESTDQGEVVVLYCDLEKLETIEGFVKAFCAKAWALDGILNAETATMEEFGLTDDGIERHFAINHLAHFKLTSLLMDELVRTAAASGREGRVVNLTSNLHHFTYRVRQGTIKPSRGIDFVNLNSDMGYTPMNSYGQSKLANLLHAWTLSEQLAKKGSPVRCVAATPGMTELELERSLTFPGGSFLSSMLKSTITSSLEDAVVTPLYCLTAAKLPQGTYFSKCLPVKSSLPSRDPRLASKLWEFSEEMAFATERA